MLCAPNDRAKLSQIVRKQLRLLHGRKMPAARRLVPMRNGKAALSPSARTAEDFRRIDRDSGRRRDTAGPCTPSLLRQGLLAVEPDRRGDSARVPIKRDVAEHRVPGHGIARVAPAATFTIGPAMKFLG